MHAAPNVGDEENQRESRDQRLQPGEMNSGLFAGSGSTSEQPLNPAISVEAQAPDGWRNEVAARLRQYQARRRPRVPRYPSLQLKFESNLQPRRPRLEVEDVSASAGSLDESVSEKGNVGIEDSASTPISHFLPGEAITPVASAGRLLAFPRSVPLPPRLLDTLADPVFDRPRILDVPEVAPTPPALGGISIEAAEQNLELKRPGFELPLQPAPMHKRLLAGVVDAALVTSAVAVFSYLFFRWTGFVPLPMQELLMLSGTAVFFWAAYQYLFIVYEGKTPGLILARLRLSCFDGSPAPRSRRRWRAWSAVLSGLSLGLGYAWCLLDEDQLCWHDRITRTYMAPR